MAGKQQKFVIFCQARSGSTLLRLSLHAHPQLVCHGEVLSREWINGLVPLSDPLQDRSAKESVEALLPIRASDPVDFLKRNVWNFDSEAVGFKLVLEDFFKSEHKARYQDYFISESIVPVILYRRDQLANYASRVRMVKYKIKHTPTEEAEQSESSHKKIELSLATLERFAAEQRDYLVQLRDLFKNPLLMTYEGLRDDYPMLLARLGVAQQVFTEKLVKTSPGDLSQVIHDYDRLRHSGNFEINLS